MTTDRPDADELLTACSRHLEELTTGRGAASRYDLRLLQRALEVARAELRLGPELEAAEEDALRALLGSDDTVDALRVRLAGEIRAGAWPLDDPALLAHLRADTARRCRLTDG